MRARMSSGDVGHVQAEHAHAPLLRHDESEQRLEHRALAGAVRPEQTHGTRRQSRRDVVAARGCVP